MEPQFVKIGADGTRLPIDATKWEAVLNERTGLLYALDVVKVESQQEAEIAAKACLAGGFTDWRIGSVRETFDIVDHSHFAPAIDPRFFPETPNDDWYWTGTLYTPNREAHAWSVYFRNGTINWHYRNDSGYVRAVRANQ